MVVVFAMFVVFLEELFVFIDSNLLNYLHPEADPLSKFPEDQFDRLNRKVLDEIAKLDALNIRVEANSSPPSIDEMETYITCMDAGEWNASCHLKLTYVDKVIFYII